MRLSTTRGTEIGHQVSQQVRCAYFEIIVFMLRKLAELLEAVRASLRAKVAALADDNWMYEAEDDVAPR
jgi:hypothetical protein